MTVWGTDILFARREEEAGMVDRCRITSSVSGAWDTTTKTYADAEITTIYEGPCRLILGNTAVRYLTAQGQDFREHDGVLKLPVDAATIPSATGSTASVAGGHLAEVLEAPLDPSLVGSKYRVEMGHRQTIATTRRFPVKESA